MPVHREPQREARRFRDVAGWVFPDVERDRSDPSTGATTSTVGTNTGVTALQQLRFLVRQICCAACRSLTRGSVAWAAATTCAQFLLASCQRCLHRNLFCRRSHVMGATVAS